MGLYPINCTTCGKPFLWFSGILDQRCYDCMEKNNENNAPLRKVFRQDADGKETKILFQGLRKGDKFRLAPADGMEDPYIDPTEISIACCDAFQNSFGVWTIESEKFVPWDNYNAKRDI